MDVGGSSVEVVVGCLVAVGVAVGTGVSVRVGRAGSLALAGRAVFSGDGGVSVDEESQAVAHVAITSSIAPRASALQNLLGPIFIVFQPPAAIG